MSTVFALSSSACCRNRRRCKSPDVELTTSSLPAAIFFLRADLHLKSEAAVACPNWNVLIGHWTSSEAAVRPALLAARASAAARGLPDAWPRQRTAQPARGAGLAAARGSRGSAAARGLPGRRAARSLGLAGAGRGGRAAGAWAPHRRATRWARGFGLAGAGGGRRAAFPAAARWARGLPSRGTARWTGGLAGARRARGLHAGARPRLHHTPAHRCLALAAADRGLRECETVDTQEREAAGVTEGSCGPRLSPR